MGQTDIVAGIVKAVAAADGVEPADIDPLYEYMNPEALYSLSEQDGGEWSLTFQYSDHQVTVTNGSQVVVDGVAYTPNVSSTFDT